MGLDNGIVVCANSYTYKIKWMKQDIFHHVSHTYEICYWRKCWQIRNAIFNIINPAADNDTETDCTVEDIVAIRKMLKTWNKKSWEATDPYWEWEDMKPVLKRQIRDLGKLIKAMKRYPLRVYFYDSW